MTTCHPYTRTLSDAFAFAGAARQHLDVGLSDVGALSILSSDGPLSMGALANALGLSKATMTTMVDRLEARELVFRAGDPIDRRVVWIACTSAGKRRLRDALADAEATA